MKKINKNEVPQVQAVFVYCNLEKNGYFLSVCFKLTAKTKLPPHSHPLPTSLSSGEFNIMESVGVDFNLFCSSSFFSSSTFSTHSRSIFLELQQQTYAISVCAAKLLFFFLLLLWMVKCIIAQKSSESSGETPAANQGRECVSERVRTAMNEAIPPGSRQQKGWIVSLVTLG